MAQGLCNAIESEVTCVRRGADFSVEQAAVGPAPSSHGRTCFFFVDLLPSHNCDEQGTTEVMLEFLTAEFSSRSYHFQALAEAFPSHGCALYSI